MKKLMVVICLLLASCGSSNWVMFKAPFFDFTVPPGFELKRETKNLLQFESDTGSITIAWSMDQYSMKDQPATEAVTGNPGDRIVVSEPQILGKNKVWYSEIQTKDGWRVYLTLPLDRGEMRVEAVSKGEPSNIRQSVRSVVVTNETYFSYPH